VVHSRTHTQRVCCMVFLAVGLGLDLGLGSVKALSRHVAGCSSPLEAAPADPTPSHVASESQPAVAVHPVQPLETLAGHAPQPSPSIASSIRQQSFTGSSISIHCHAMPELTGPPQKPPPQRRAITRSASLGAARPRRAVRRSHEGRLLLLLVLVWGCTFSVFPRLSLVHAVCQPSSIRYQVSATSATTYSLLLYTAQSRAVADMCRQRASGPLRAAFPLACVGQVCRRRSRARARATTTTGTGTLHKFTRFHTTLLLTTPHCSIGPFCSAHHLGKAAARLCSSWDWARGAGASRAPALAPAYLLPPPPPPAVCAPALRFLRALGRLPK
jgi:hypothetical protein